MKKIFAALLALIMLVSLTACGGSGDEYAGKYLCVGEAYYDGELGEPYGESWLELKAGGKGIYYSGTEFNLSWKIEGEKFEGTIEFWGIKENMNGTIKDGVVDVKYGDMRIRFVKEGATAPSGNGTSGESSGIAGYYPISGAIIGGKEWSYEELEANDMTDGSYFLFNADGTGEIGFSGEEVTPVTYDEKACTFTDENGISMDFTVEGDTITVKYGGDGEDSMTMYYTRSSDLPPKKEITDTTDTTDSNDGADTAVTDSAYDFDDVTVAESFFGRLKTEFFYNRIFDNVEDFITKLNGYIGWYNNRRIKSRLGISPVEYRLLTA